MFKWLRKNERGSIMVIVALSMAVLLGFAGFAVDFGVMALKKQELQNAADAAALAGGQDRMKGGSVSTATNTANSLITANDINLGDGVTFSNITVQGSRVTVTITTQVNTPFTSLVTGQKTRQVSATAVAEYMGSTQNLPYALFAGQHIEDGGSGVTSNGGAHVQQVTGNVHSNSNINLSHVTITGTVTAVNSIKVGSATSSNAGNYNSTGNNDLYIPMPNMDSVLGAFMSDPSHVITVNKSSIELNKNYGLQDLIDEYIDGQTPGPYGLTIYITGNLTSKNNAKQKGAFENLAYPLNIIVEGDLDMNGTPLQSSPTTPIMLFSKTGDIKVHGQGTGDGFCGIVYAANGTVTLCGGNGAKYNGSIYAQTITNNGNDFNITYNDHVDDHFPKGKVRLVE